MKKKNIIIHPFLLALYPVLFLFSVNADEVQFYQTIIPSILLVVSSFVVFWILRFLLNKNSAKAALLTSFFFLTFFFFGNLFNAIVYNWITSFQQRYLILFYTVVYIVLFLVVKRAKNNFSGTVNPLNIIAVSLTIFNIGNIVYNNSTVNFKKEVVTDNYHNIGSSLSLGYKPDIYLIILDEYAREDVLREVHDMDNSGFLNALRSRGFFVADSSHSNYSHTPQSVSALMNFKYVQGSRANDFIQQKEIQSNITFQLLKKMGYTTIAFLTGSECTKFRKTVDKYISYPHINDFDFNLIFNTPFRSLLYLRFTTDFRHRKPVLFPFEYMKQNKFTESPRFVYTHVLCPHRPYVFGPNGEVVDRPDASWGKLNDTPELYKGQVIFINKVVLEAVDTIFSRSQHPPIIIVMGDHGSRVWDNPYSADYNNLTEQFSNLCAIYFPKGGDKELYPSITPVNIFRIMFNQYFGGNLELLPDKSYFYSTSDTRFVDVTEDIKKEIPLEDLPPIKLRSYLSR